MILLFVQVFSAFAIVGLVLLQRGKGAEAGAGFGAGASGTVFGARGATTALSRATAVFAAIFMLNSLALAYMGTHAGESAPKTILDEAVQPKPNPAPAGSAPAGSAPAGATTAGSATAPAVTPAPSAGAPAAPAPSAPPPAQK